MADLYGLARSAVIELLRADGVAIRHPKVTPADTAQAVVWYREVVRQVGIAARLGREKAVVWNLLKRAGAI